MKKEFGQLFMKFFLPYISVLLIVFCFVYVAYTTAFNEIESNAISMQNAYLQQSKSVLDRRFTEVTDAVFQVRSLRSVEAFKDLTYDEVEADYLQAYNLRSELEDLWFRNEIIKGYYVIFRHSKVIASPNGLYYYDQLNELALAVEGMDNEDLWEVIFSEFYLGNILHSRKMDVFKSEVQGIAIVMSLGYNYEKSDGVVYMVMDGDLLKENMIPFTESFNGNFFILDEGGEILLSMNESYGLTDSGHLDHEVIDNEAVVVMDQSETIPYTYMLIQPREKVFEEIRSMRKTINLLGIVLVILGIFVSGILARKNSLPVANLMSHNELLTKRVNLQLPHLRTTFLERWLTGAYGSKDEIMAVIDLLNTSYIGSHYCVLVIDYDEHIDLLNNTDSHNLKQLEMKRLEIKDVIVNQIFEAEYIHDIDHDKLAIIMVGEQGSYDVFHQWVIEKISECNLAFDALSISDIHYGIGNIYEEIMDVSLSLNNALDALTISVGSGEGSVFWFEDIGDNADTYYYPIEIESRIVNGTRAGESEMVIQTIRDVFNKNLVERNLDNVLMKALVFDLWGTLNKLRERNVEGNHDVNTLIDSAYEQLQMLSDLERIQMYKKTIVSVANYYQEERSKKQDNMMASIVTYIGNHMEEPDFGLQTIADAFGISYKYVSKMFKAFSGVKFSDYLEDIRMKQVESLLIETDLPVQEVYRRCGYYSNNTFGKAFKRRHGISASVYRQQSLINQ